MAADDASVDVVGPPAAVGLGTHDRGELLPAKSTTVVSLSSKLRTVCDMLGEFWAHFASFLACIGETQPNS